jgi:hypothetical protein
LGEKTKGIAPIGEAANPHPQTWIAEKTFQISCIFTQQSFSVLDANE